ncbi:hypothetical protein QTP88_029328 [Uroleucon formosanum]
MSNSKLSGAQRRKLQKEKDDKHNNVMTKVKKLDHFFNVLPSNVSKTSKSNEAAPSSTSSVTESDDSNVKEDELYEECLHFKQFLNEIEIEESDKKSPSMFLKILREKKIISTFPNLDTALKMYLTIIPSNATGERSFSILKRIKNYLSNSISDTKVSSLASFSANSELLESMNFNDLINKFAATKSRKRQV